MKPTLFSYYRSSCAYRVRLALHYKEIPFDYRPIHLLNQGGEQYYDDFKILNPMSQVPYWIDDKVQIGQSMAIITYLEDRYPEAKELLPKDSAQKAKIMEFCEIINSGIQPLHNLSVTNYITKELEVSEAGNKSMVQHYIKKGLLSLEKKVQASGEACFGNFSMADVFLIPQVYAANRFEVSLENYPKIARIMEHCMGQDFVQKAHPDNQPDAP